MDMSMTLLIGGGICLGLAGSLAYRHMGINQKLRDADKKARKSMDASNRKSQSILSKAQRDAQEIISAARKSVEEEVKSRRDGVQKTENRLMQREKHLDDRDSRLNDKDIRLSNELERVKQLGEKYDAQIEELVHTLENVAGMSQDAAQKMLLANVEKQSRSRAGKMIKDIEAQARKIANRKAKEIVVDAIQRTAVNHIPASTTSLVQLPDDEMKGRIIGKEGRNIRAFESATGCDVIIDDTPGAVVLSCFNPIRREVASLTLQKLVADGRIHPTRIEEAVQASQDELHQTIIKKGEAAAEELKLQFHPKIIELLGKLYYRTSYGQNILSHSVEAAHVAGIMAAELGVNVDLAKRGTVLHDIGKALDFEQVGTHIEIGDEICRKYGESEEVINCINAHHEDEAPETIEAIVVMMADAISSARPGARRESVEAYIKRLEKLEAIACSFDGVNKAYAIQAGREIRVGVQPDVIDDDGIHKLAQDIALQIESEMEYPGEVQVSIVRETRAVGVAR